MLKLAAQIGVFISSAVLVGAAGAYLSFILCVEPMIDQISAGWSVPPFRRDLLDG